MTFSEQFPSKHMWVKGLLLCNEQPKLLDEVIFVKKGLNICLVGELKEDCEIFCLLNSFLYLKCVSRR